MKYCCEEFMGNVRVGKIHEGNDKKGHPIWGTEYLVLKYCPFCGVKLEGEK